MLNCNNITEKQYFMKQNTSNYTHFGTMEVIGSSQSNMAETDVHSRCILGVVNNALQPYVYILLRISPLTQFTNFVCKFTNFVCKFTNFSVTIFFTL